MYQPINLYQTHAISTQLAYVIELYKFQLTEVSSNDGNFHQRTFIILSHKCAKGLVTNYFLTFVSFVFINCLEDRKNSMDMILCHVSVLTITKSTISQ